MSGTAWGANVFQDLRSAAQLLRKNYGFASITVLVLALGIGINTAIFSFVDAVLLRSLPVAEPERLVLVEGRSATGTTLISYPMYRDMIEQQQVFTDLIASRDYLAEPLRVRLGGAGGMRAVRGGAVTGNYFSSLGLVPTMGRLFLANDDDPYRPASVAVVSYEFWRHQMNSSPSVVGQSIEINDEPFTIVGVGPKGFGGMSINTSLEIWVPLTKFRDPRLLTGRQGTFFRLIGRLKPGVTVGQAEQAMTLMFQQLRAEEAQATGASTGQQRFRIALSPGDKGYSLFRETLGRPSMILMVMAVLLLASICLNLTTLLSARATMRQREMAVRQALGASHRRLAQQLVTENVVLSILGGLVGLVIAIWASQVLLGFVATEVALSSGFNQYVPDGLSFRIDLRVLAFTIGVAALAGLALGLAPVLLMRRSDLNTSLRERATISQGISVGQRRIPIGKLLVVAQVTVSVVLLVGAGLMVRTVMNLRGLDPGFDPKKVLVVDLDLTSTRRTGEQLTAFERTLHERLNAVPGVTSASLSWISLFSDSDRRMPVVVDGQRPPASDEELAFARKDVVSPGYFETIGMTLVAGRTFTLRDNETAPKVAVVNEAFVRRFFPRDHPIGRRFTLGRNIDPAGAIEIVGIVKDAKYNDLRDGTRDMFYLPLLQTPDSPPRSIQVQSAGLPQLLASAIRQVVKEADPNIVITDVKTLVDQVDRTLVRERLLANLAGFFGGIALLLACIGLYSVMAYHVLQRTQEIGLRIALGSPRAKVLWLVSRDALVLSGLGLLFGVPLAISFSRVVESFLFDLTPTDPTTIGFVIVTLLSVAGLACYFPARRAARVDPIIALRSE